MFWIDQRRWLPAHAVFAALASVSVSVLLAQPSSTPQVPTSQSQAPATSPATAPTPPPSPEQIGDALMARQRYQAAIEAYKKGPRNSAVLWNKMGIAYQLMLNQDEAMRCYERSLKLDPRNAVVL